MDSPNKLNRKPRVSQRCDFDAAAIETNGFSNSLYQNVEVTTAEAIADRHTRKNSLDTKPGIPTEIKPRMITQYSGGVRSPLKHKANGGSFFCKTIGCLDKKT